MTRVAEVGRGIRGAIAASGAKHRRMRAGAAVFVVAAAVGVLGVTSSEGATQRAAAGSTVTLAIFQEPDTLDPAAATLISSYQVLQSIFDPLMYQIGGKLYPGLATSMTVSKDSRTYTFMLRKGVTFQDGTPFNAQAVKFNFDRIVNPKYKAGTALGNLGPYQATKVVNPYEVQIIFKTPNASFENEVTTQPFGISSPTAIRKYGANYGSHPVGTGPFTFKQWQKGQAVQVVKNPKYNWGPAGAGNTGAAKIAGVTFRILSDNSAQANALQTGEVTIAQNLNPPDVQSDLKSGKFFRLAAPATGIPYALLLNTQKAPTDDLKVRQALEWATDQGTIVKTLFGGLVTPATSVYMAGMQGYSKSQHIYSYNPAKANALLDADGWTQGSGGIRTKNGTKLSVDLVSITNFGFDGIAQLVQAQFKAIGVQANLSDEGFPGVFQDYNKGVQNIANFFYYDVDPFSISSIFGCKFVGNGLNWAHFCDKTFDAQVAAANGISNTAARTAAYQKLGTTIMNDAAIIPIYNPNAQFIGSKSLHGLKFTVNTAPMFNNVTMQ
jgi:peptide/nickel transport system substrate-binding protein